MEGGRQQGAREGLRGVGRRERGEGGSKGWVGWSNGGREGMRYDVREGAGGGREGGLREKGLRLRKGASEERTERGREREGACGLRRTRV